MYVSENNVFSDMPQEWKILPHGTTSSFLEVSAAELW